MRIRSIRKCQTIPGRAGVDGVSGKDRIDARIERDLAAKPNEAIWNVAERDVLPLGTRTHAQRPRNCAIAPYPDASSSIVLQKEGIFATANAATRLKAAETDVHREIEFNGGALVGSPRGRKRNAAAFPGNVRHRRACAVRESVSV